MHIETIALSLIGDRDENQDRLSVVERDGAVLAVVVDGMGGHESGAEAAQVAVDNMLETFDATTLPVAKPKEFLHSLLHQAHNAVVALGDNRSLGAKPRATCAVALIQGNRAMSAHIGDSRVYLLRDCEVVARTRDHSHIEILLQEGLITEDEYREHPLRNYVEYCLGGEPGEPHMAISDARLLQAGDVVMLCSDGLWSGAEDADIAISLCGPDGQRDLSWALKTLMERAITACAPAADNTTAALVRWHGSDAEGETAQTG